MLRVLTDVFPPHIKPVRDGWYLTQPYPTFPVVLTWWELGSWHSANGQMTVIQDLSWRGLAFDPAGAFDHDSWNWKEPGNIESGGYEQGVFVPGASCC